MIATYYIEPVAKPRMSQRDKWAKRPAVLKYRAFCDEARRIGVTVAPGDGIVFFLPMPKSWSAYKRHMQDGTKHEARPDLSNLLKALEDAVCSEDSHLWHYSHLSKRWAERGAIVLWSGECQAMTDLGAERYILEDGCPAQPT